MELEIITHTPAAEARPTPVLVLGARDDRLIIPGEVEATARAYNTRATFFPHMGHAMMLDVGWQAVADRILDWLNSRE